MIDHARYAAAAREAVITASIICREVQDNLEQVSAMTKDDKSPVTIADLASQAIVGMILKQKLGEDLHLVAEEDSAFLRDEDNALYLRATLATVQGVWPEATENKLLDAIDLGAGDTDHHSFWTLDPIDGTKGFLRNQQYAVALGYIEHGTPTIGVMGCPNLPVDLSEPFDQRNDHGCLYMAIQGDGVYESACDDVNSEVIRITRLDHEEGEEISVCASVEKAHTNMSDTDRILDWIEQQGLGHPGEPARLDSQCKYAVVARGQADAYLRLPSKKPYVERIWDHAAGSCIASESGAFVTDIFGRNLDFSTGRGLENNKGIICAPPRIHGLLVRAIKELGIGQDQSA